jgi:hypothetical protein
MTQEKNDENQEELGINIIKNNRHPTFELKRAENWWLSNEPRNYKMYWNISTSKVPVRCNGSRKKIFMTLENNMLAFTHFLRALSLHI